MEDQDGSSSEPNATDIDITKNHYFQFYKGTLSTSKHTLENIKLMQESEIFESLRKTKKKHEKEKQELDQVYKGFYSQWRFELLQGYNLLFFGIGSKRAILNDFSKEKLKDSLIINVNGYSPMTRVLYILQLITGTIMKSQQKFRSMLEHAQYIKNHFSSTVDRPSLQTYEISTAISFETLKETHLFLIIHNIDGVSFRSLWAQTILGILASTPNIHIVASIDHVNSSNLWDMNELEKFNWLWYDVTNYADYNLETSYEESILLGSRGVTKVHFKTASAVLRTITSNSREILGILIENRLKNASSRVQMEFQELLSLANERFYISNESDLKSHLQEFKDHNILTIKRGKDGRDVIELLLPTSSLIKLKDEIDSFKN